MRAMVLETPGAPLRLRDLPEPRPGPGEVLVEVEACAVCRTDLHILDGDLPHPGAPVVPGHEVVGVVRATGSGVERPAVGERVGIPWLGWTCGACPACRRGDENLCEEARFTGYGLPGGFAEQVCADARYCFPIPAAFEPVAAAPLLCAGLIGHRARRMAGPAERLGLYGFGAAAHLAAQVAVHEGQEVYAFTRDGDSEGQAFARELGARWAGGSSDPPPEPLDGAVIFAPVGELVPRALEAVRPGGTVVCGGIHMTDLPSMPYRLLWGERVLRSVANLTRRDGDEFLPLAAEVGLRPRTRTYPLERAGDALEDLRAGRLQGAAVLVPG